MLDEKQVRHVAKLARIDLTDEEVKKFAEDLSAYLTDYKIVNEHEPSRVVLLAKSKDTKIDFDKFFEKIVNGKLN